jgi:hypothetical protein
MTSVLFCPSQRFAPPLTPTFVRQLFLFLPFQKVSTLKVKGLFYQLLSAPHFPKCMEISHHDLTHRAEGFELPHSELEKITSRRKSQKWQQDTVIATPISSSGPEQRYLIETKK